MYRLVEVKTKREQKDFVDFPLKLYKGNPYFVPCLYGDERKILRGDWHLKYAKQAFYLVYDGKKVVGRIQAIISRLSNEKEKAKRVRFTRFDAIDDPEVAKLLFGAVEQFARDNGMDCVCGPLGYSDMDREGLLIEGFNELSTFEEQYNYPYYQKLIEGLGYEKEVDWVERKLYAPKELDTRIGRIADAMMKRNNLRFAVCKSTKEMVKRYGDAFFDLIDETYKDLYMTIDFPEEERKEYIAAFKLLISPKYVRIIVDKDDKVVAIGLCFPSIGKALQKSGGKLTLPCLIKVLKAVKRPEIIDLGLIGILPKYQNSGVSWAIFYEIMKMLYEGGVAYCETNLNLEDNKGIQNNWGRFENVLHKRRRSYLKKIA